MWLRRCQRFKKPTPTPTHPTNQRAYKPENSAVNRAAASAWGGSLEARMPLWGSAVHQDSSYSCLAQVCNACVTRALEATSGSAPSSTLCTWFGATRHHRSSCNEEHKGNSQQKQQQRKLGNYCTETPLTSTTTGSGDLLWLSGGDTRRPRASASPGLWHTSTTQEAEVARCGD